MSSIIKLEALSGVRDDGPLCYLLQVDESFILLDCGWDESFDLSYIEAVKARIPQVNAVLLSYADPSHLGALPYLVAKCGLSVPVYATVPVFKMGQMFMYDWVNGHQNVEDFDLFTLDDVDAAFERVQQILLKGDSGIQFTPLPAGHMIGGSIWKISKQGDEEIVYAVDFNHKKERHINGCVFDSISRPHLLITDAYNALYNQPKRKNRDEELVTKIIATAKNNGDCMVVIDTAGRILEIAHLLDQLWSNADANLANINLVMLSHVASTVVDFVKSQVEWMSDKVLKTFDSGRSNPFSFKNIKLCHSHLELDRVRSPKVVLCSGPDVESGFSRELFLEWSSDSRNMIILTTRTGERTLGSKLIRMADATGGRSASRQITLEVKRRIPLEGHELEQYVRKKAEKEQEAAKQRLEASRRNARLGMQSQDSDEDSEDEEALANAVAAVTGVKQKNKPNPNPDEAGPVSSTPVQSMEIDETTDSSHDVLFRWEQHQRAAFFKQSKKTYPMFPYVEEKAKWDDYGEIIRPEEFMTTDSLVPQITEHDDDDDKKSALLNISGDFTQPPPAKEERPTKCVAYVQKIEILCKVEYIDFEGRSDAESIKKILTQIKPKQLIIVHGSPAATRYLAQFAQENQVVQGKIFTPRLGEIVDATVESHIFQVSLSDAVMSSLLFQTVKEADLSWIDAKVIRRQVPDVEDEKENNDLAMEVDDVTRDDGDAEPSMPRLLQKKKQDTFYLDIIASSSIPIHQAVFINDPKLSDMKQLLLSQGYQAEFSSGVLYINGVASIRRNEAGRFHVEGCASKQYYEIRDLIYQQFAII